MAYATNFDQYSLFPKLHMALTKSDTVDFPNGPCLVYCTGAGTVTAVDQAGTAFTYTLNAGDIVPVPCRRVNATNSTATIVGLY